jgi:leader peptidase (prepilin peptidase)/N-methyltransferase
VTVTRRSALPAALAATVVAALAGAAFAAVGFGPGTFTAVVAAFAAVFAGLAAWVAVADLRSFEIPDGANVALLAAGLAWAAVGTSPSSLPLTPALVFGTDADTPAWAATLFGMIDGLARAAIAAGTLLAVRAFYQRARGIEGLGLGDIKLAGAVAPWLAWPDLPTALFVAVLGALIVTIGASLVARRRLDGAAWIPFGAFLAPAAWLVWALRVAGVPIPLLG